MKLRYLLVTLLMIGVLVYGAANLVVSVSEAMERPVEQVELSSLPPVPAQPEQPKPTVAAVADTVVQPKTTAKDTVAVSAPVQETVAAQTPTPVQDDLYSSQKLNEATRKYAGTRPLEWGEEVSGMVSKVNLPKTNEKVLFITFNIYQKDYPAFFEFLTAHKVKSTVFLSGRWVRRNAERAQEIGASSLFEIGNTGENNRPLSVKGDSVYGLVGTPSLTAAISEVSTGAGSIRTAAGRTPRYVRPYVNYADNVVVSALADAGIKTIGYSRSCDGGGVYSTARIKTELLEAEHGDIILLSINPDYPNILAGFKAAIEEIEQSKLPVRFEHLSGYEPYFVLYRR